MVDVEVKINNKGLEKELALMQKMANASVKIGIQSDAGKHKESGVYVADIAIWNEFGTDKIPPRPFIRQCFADNQGLVEKYLQRVVLNVANGSDIKLELARLGLWYENKQKYTLRHYPWKENSKATKKRKKSSKPLIDTSQLVNSIRYQVEV
ncbi:hypothetical protein QS62_07915 [Gallibacterium salpingitidis]|uniref:Uncharacterized protein n=2 Tax=Gallibacterium salpingitidis TaxID=505341 RepID=A0A1A7NTQ6_9PAST|nr:hypothetical protein QS62_07915 [Gallibacterium salpingitidis]